MLEVDLPPFAPTLMESMRSMGYSPGSALADLIDNSISAGARSVNIEFRPSPEPYVAIIDDGQGMTGQELQDAMRHGTCGPLTTRVETDLGRFGLGLKTASLSQCRQLTVVTLKSGTMSACRWDLDVVIKRERWVLLALDPDETRCLPHLEHLETSRQGTIVIWQKLDRLLAGEHNPEDAIGERVDEARQHVALVFHRFLSGEAGVRRLAININGNRVDAVDPYLLENSLTQRLSDDSFKVAGTRILVKPYILPHPSRLTATEAERAGGNDGLRSQQGFYVYRQRRLIIWGTWFRLARKDELSRLARVRVDIPNSLDHLWTLDIRKSVAFPPDAVRLQLRRTVERIRNQSRLTHVTRGRTERQGEIERAWTRVFSAGTVRYDINREHPAIKAIAEACDPETTRRAEAALRVIERSFPIESLYVDMASEQKIKSSGDEESLRQLAHELIAGLAPDSPTRTAILTRLHMLEPFSNYPDIARRIAAEIMQ